MLTVSETQNVSLLLIGIALAWVLVVWWALAAFSKSKRRD